MLPGVAEQWPAAGLSEDHRDQSQGLISQAKAGARIVIRCSNITAISVSTLCPPPIIPLAASLFLMVLQSNEVVQQETFF